MIYVQGQNDDKLLCHVTGMRIDCSVPWPAPDGNLALAENRYPITEIGLRRLLERLIEIGEMGLREGNCQVNVRTLRLRAGPVRASKLNIHGPSPGSPSTKPKSTWMTNETCPSGMRPTIGRTRTDGVPELVEEYTYSDLKSNRGFSDQDFDVENPEYAFARNSPVVHAK